MGDRCYMKLTCEKVHAPLFEALGFEVEADHHEHPGLVEMVDEQANYAHWSEMPENVPYFGFHTAGGEYGDTAFVCDGKELCYVDTNHQSDVMVRVDEQSGRVSKADLAGVRRYRQCRQRTERRLGLAKKRVP
ncbi:MAG: hypothetical protein ABFE07_29055 [Armatimonadia bacterium]